MTYILGLAGRKQAGKDSIAKFLIKNKNEIFNLYQMSTNGPEFIIHKENPVIRISMADKLKQVCMELFGLTYEQCYGTNEQKNTLTKLKWEDLPHFNYIRSEIHDILHDEHSASFAADDEDEFWEEWQARTPKGLMTARQVLQEFGSGVCRRMLTNVWIDACIREINKKNPFMAIIADIRFPNEVEGVQDAGGKIIKLTRTIFPDDKHASETSLDKYKNFDATIANDNMDVSMQCKATVDILRSWDWCK